MTIEKDYGDLNCLPQRLNQVFMNILVNASQVIEKQGVIRIKISQDEVSQYVSISDDGCGITAENQGGFLSSFLPPRRSARGSD